MILNSHWVVSEAFSNFFSVPDANSLKTVDQQHVLCDALMSQIKCLLAQKSICFAPLLMRFFTSQMIY